MTILSRLYLEVKEISAKSGRKPGGVIGVSDWLSLSNRRKARNDAVTMPREAFRERLDRFLKSNGFEI